MKILFFDCFSGISGDMTIAALLDLGIDFDIFRKEISKLNIDGYELIIEKKIIKGITGTDVKVVLEDEHSHGHQHGHLHTHGHNHSHHAHHERNLKEIIDIIDRSSLNFAIKEFSKKVFKEIATAEAKVHNKDINEIHFHEVGAIDSIVDIAGTAICLDLLKVDKVYSSALHDGKGFIECRHGIIPVPVPAVMQMLSGSDIPLISEDINTELITPTGMGIIKSLASSYGEMPAIKIDKIGYGMGKRETGKLNALRVVMGNTYEADNNIEHSKQSMLEEVAVLETNIDDMSSEILGYTTGKLFESGALDVFYTPIYMKKNRPAYMLTVLTKLEDEEKIVDIILKETSTIGIRRSVSKRYCLNREIVKVQTKWGEVAVKRSFKEDFEKISPEYEDCKKIADKTGISLKDVYDEVIQNYHCK